MHALIDFCAVHSSTLAESRCAVDQLVVTRAVDVVAVDVDDDVVDVDVDDDVVDVV